MELTGDKTTRKGTEQKFIEGICNGMAKKPTEMKRKGMVRKRIGTELIGADVDWHRTAKLWSGRAKMGHGEEKLGNECNRNGNAMKVADQIRNGQVRSGYGKERNGTKPKWSGVDSC